MSEQDLLNARLGAPLHSKSSPVPRVLPPVCPGPHGGRGEACSAKATHAADRSLGRPSYHSVWACQQPPALASRCVMARLRGTYPWVYIWDGVLFSNDSMPSQGRVARSNHYFLLVGVGEDFSCVMAPWITSTFHSRLQ